MPGRAACAVPSHAPCANPWPDSRSPNALQTAPIARAPAVPAAASKTPARPCWPALLAPTRTLAHSRGGPFPPPSPLPETDKVVPKLRWPTKYLYVFCVPPSSSCLILPLQSKTRVAEPSPQSGITRWNRGAARSASDEHATGLRSMLFGVNTTSGFRHGPQRLPPQ